MVEVKGFLCTFTPLKGQCKLLFLVHRAAACCLAQHQPAYLFPAGSLHQLRSKGRRGLGPPHPCSSSTNLRLPTVITTAWESSISAVDYLENPGSVSQRPFCFLFLFFFFLLQYICFSTWLMCSLVYSFFSTTMNSVFEVVFSCIIIHSTIYLAFNICE